MEITENGTYSFVPNGIDEMELDINVAGSTTTVPDIAKVGYYDGSDVFYENIIKNNVTVNDGQIVIPAGSMALVILPSTSYIRYYCNVSSSDVTVGVFPGTGFFVGPAGNADYVQFTDSNNKRLLELLKPDSANSAVYSSIFLDGLTCTVLTN